VSPPAGTTPAGSGRSASPLTTRAAILGLVVCTLVFSAALPLREFLAQRGEIASMEQEQAEARERVAALEHAKQQLEDPAYIAAEARRRLNMARPGEVSYVLIPPTAPVAPDEGVPDTQVGPDAPWWSQVWASVAAADRGAADGPAEGEQPVEGEPPAEPPPAP
jgi:cell division protein FtsB